MANLLPEQTRTGLLWDRRIRVALVLFMMSFFSFGVAAATLLPAMLYSRVLIGGIEGAQANNKVGGPSLGAQRQEIIQELHQGSELLESIKLINTLPKTGDLLIKAERLATSVIGIKVQLIAVDTHIEKGLSALRLSGTAESRGGVVAMRTVFEESDDFTVTDFPLSNLTPQGDEYNFVIEMTSSLPDILDHKKDKNE